MRKLLIIAAMMFVAAIPAKADEAAVKKQVEQMADAYMVCFNIKQDPDCIATLSTSDGFIANGMGAHKIADYYGNAFKAGFTKLDAKTTQVQLVGSDERCAIGVGTFHITGKDKDGKELDASGTWTAIYVKDGDKLKIRMLTAAPKPPPAK